MPIEGSVRSHMSPRELIPEADRWPPSGTANSIERSRSGRVGCRLEPVHQRVVGNEVHPSELANQEIDASLIT